MLYPDNIQMHADAIIASELGMIVPAFILGPIIAQIFGESEEKDKIFSLIKKSIKQYIKSPIGIALVVGILLSILNFKMDNIILNFTDRILGVISSGITLIPLILIGLILESKSFKNIFLLVCAALTLQMIIEPYMSNYLSRIFNLDPTEKEVLIILSITPSALLTPAFALKYNCSPETCSAITFVCVVSTTVLLPIGYYLLR